MFFPRTSPLSLDESGLHSLRVALNTPILCILELPPGPATAGIAVHAEKGGQRALTIAVRALRGGEVVFFTLDEDLSHDGAVLGAIDGALSFAEAMGFLFDDEVETLTAAQRRQAFARWRELVGETKKGSARAPAAPAEELVLEEAVELEEAAPSDPPPRRAEAPAKGASTAASRATPAPAAATPLRGVSLTKFRKRSPGAAAPRVDGEDSSDAARAAQAARKAVLMTPHGPALGRLQLIKRRRSGDAAPAANWLARLLGSF